MNQQSNPARRYESSVYQFSLLTLGIVVCAAALAIHGTARAGDSYSATISITGLDLSTPEGIRVARARIQKAARSVCTRAEDLDDLSHHYNYLICVDAATTVAMQQIAQTSVASVAKNSVP